MFIIWGTKNRITTISSGQFYCPQCNSSRNYAQRRLANYFTLFFIPLFPISTHDVWIECHSCGNAFQEAVLNFNPNSNGIVSEYQAKVKEAMRKKIEDEANQVRENLKAEGKWTPEAEKRIRETVEELIKASSEGIDKGMEKALQSISNQQQ